MTGQEWLQASDPAAMLGFLRGRASDRKLRLFLCDGYRKLPTPKLPGNTQKAALLVERYADGLADRKELLDARSQVWDSVTRFGEQLCRSRALPALEDRLHHASIAAVAQGTNPSTEGLFELAVPALLQVIEEKPLAADILRDIFGPLPFRPVTIDPAWLTWHDGLLVSMAQKMYDSRDFADMPVLADALEEAGCQDQDILRHCRSGDDHVRGFWVVDLLLGKS